MQSSALLRASAAPPGDEEEAPTLQHQGRMTLHLNDVSLLTDSAASGEGAVVSGKRGFLDVRDQFP